MSIKSKIQSLITAANAKTGETDATLTDAVQTLVDGYRQGDSLIERGSISYHTGVTKTTAAIPVSDTSLDHYVVLLYATNLWTKVDGEWVEQSNVDFTGIGSVASGFVLSAFVGANLEPASCVNNAGNLITQSAYGFTPWYRFSGDTILPNTKAMSVTVDAANNILVVPSYASYCVYCDVNYGMTYKYTILGWNDAQ